MGRYGEVMPDANGYDAKTWPRLVFEEGESVYVVDITHAWPATFVAYKDGVPYVQTPGGEVVAVDRRSLRKA